MNEQELFQWVSKTALEVINRNGEFTTITVLTPKGPRSFRSKGETSFVDAILKAKTYLEEGHE